ncbi:putative membrane protein At1g75140 [Tasmannia lanceolata]|uniref:putative membrane protein At1g75140 n=1 Tax=Tasmannia lanceolata TaxID=3420 RepID=UPI00406393D6
MAVFAKGKISVLLLIFILAPSSRFSFFVSFCYGIEFEQVHENKIENKQGHESDSLCLSDRQEIQLKKLEDLVKNLTETVAKLESSILDFHNFGSAKKRQLVEEPVLHFVQTEKIDSNDHGGIRSLDVKKDGVFEGKVGAAERGRGVTVTKFKPSWSERFRFLSAVKLEYEVTCINVLPYEDYEGLSKYVAVGDEKGRVYIFLLNGDVLVEFNTLSNSPITSMLSYMTLWKNETVLVTGHKDGAILVHRVWEAAANGEDWHSLFMEMSRVLVMPGKGDEDLSVLVLELHQVGRMRYVMCSDINGRIRVFFENGTLFGAATSLSRPLVFLKQRLLFLTENGVGSLDLRSMTIRESECEGMNGSVAKNYVLDASERSKAYGFSSERELIQVMLLGDIVNFKCVVRAKRKLDMDGPLAVQTIKGYLLVVNEEKVFMYNVSSPHYNRVGGPRPLFFVNMDEIISSFLNSHALLESSTNRKPLVSTDRERLVILGFGSGYVGLYRSNLPVFKAEISTVLWSSPVVICILFLIGAWQFFGKKRDSLTSWGPDDPFSTTSVETGVSLGTGPGDRTYDESARSSDLRDLRGGAIRGPSRRYVSPNRYPGGTGTSFRPNSADPNFRSATELKYRGQNLEITGFPKRREPLFANSQVVEDNID